MTKATLSAELTLSNKSALSVLKQTQAAAEDYKKTISKIRTEASLPLPDVTRPQGSRATRIPTAGGSGGGGGGSRGGSGGGGGGKGGGNMGYGLTMLGQTLDDAQYGFKSIVNNLGSVTMALGAGAGVAGAVTIAAVAVNQLNNAWDKLNATTEVAESNAKSAQDYLASVSKALDRAAESGRKYADARADLTKRESLGGAYAQEQSARVERVITLQEKLNRLQLESLPSVEKLRQEAEAQSTAEEAKNTRELQAAQARVDLQNQRLKDSLKRINDMQEELDALNAAPPGSRTNAARQRAAYLTNALPGERERADALGQDSSNTRALRDAEGRRDSELPLERQLRQKEAEKAINDKAAEDGARAAQRFWGKVENAMKAAGSIAEAYEAARLKAAAQAREQNGMKGALDIAEARSKGQTGKANRLQKAADLQSSTDKYKAAGFSDEEAAAMARREQDAATRRPGSIRGAGRGGPRSPRASLLDDQGPSALDAFKNSPSMSDRGIFTPRRHRAAPPPPDTSGATSSAAVQKADPAVTGLLQDIKDLLGSGNGHRPSRKADN